MRAVRSVPLRTRLNRFAIASCGIIETKLQTASLPSIQITQAERGRDSGFKKDSDSGAETRAQQELSRVSPTNWEGLYDGLGGVDATDRDTRCDSLGGLSCDRLGGAGTARS